MDNFCNFVDAKCTVILEVATESYTAPVPLHQLSLLVPTARPVMAYDQPQIWRLAIATGCERRRDEMRATAKL